MGRMQGLDNIVAAMGKQKIWGKSFGDLLKEQCPYHPHHKHSTAECQQLHSWGLTPKTDNGKNKDKTDKKDGDDDQDI